MIVSFVDQATALAQALADEIGYGNPETSFLNAYNAALGTEGVVPPPPGNPWLDFVSLSEYQGDLASGTPRTVVSAANLASGQDAPPHFVNNGSVLQFSGFRDNSSYSFRSELRHANEFPATGTSAMTYRVQISDSDLEEYTWGQIHLKASTSVPPPLRLSWDKSRSGQSGHLWAVVRRDSGVYERHDLGARPTGFMDVTLSLDNLVLSVSIDGVVKHTQQLSDWAGYDRCYFKCGLYLSGSAAATGTASATIARVSASHSVVTNVHSV